MARNARFQSSSREPFRNDSRLELDDRRITGTFSFLNPTHARLSPSSAPSPAQQQSSQLKPSPSSEDESEPTPTKNNQTTQPNSRDNEHTNEIPASSVSFLWRSRDNRKGRHTLLVTPADPSSKSASYLTPVPTTSLHSILHIIKLMATYYPYWDISWWVAILFTFGSIIWVINAFFVWLPLVDPWTEFDGEISVGGGWTAFVGATVFEIGSLLLMLEAVNENREGCFGWALEKAWEGSGEEHGDGKWRVKPARRCRHHHTNRKNFVGKGSKEAAAEMKGSDEAAESEKVLASESSKSEPSQPNTSQTTWQWFPSRHDLHTHYFHELGFLACLSQLFGASIFWISGFTALPGIQSLLPTQAALDGAYWAPQIIGGSGFIVSGLLFMLETQTKWYKPAWNVLGWHIGVWNFIGALGFTACGACGLAYASYDAQYQASLATFWGSWAFLVASVVQWYEGLDKHPVEVVNGPATKNGAAAAGDEEKHVGATI